MVLNFLNLFYKIIVLQDFIINDTWYISKDCLYCRNIINRPLLRLDVDSYLVNFDIAFLSELKKIIPKLHKLDKPFFFVKEFSKPDRRLIDLDESGDKIILRDIENAIRIYAIYPKLHDLLAKNNIDFIGILTDYITIHNAFDIFKNAYSNIKKEILVDEYVYPSGNQWMNPTTEPVIKRDDIRNEIISLERTVNLNKLL